MTDKKKTGDDADREIAERARAEAEAEADAAAAAAAEEALSDTDQDGEAADDDFSPEDHITELEAELAKAKDQMLRALAEAENTRRRADRDRQEAAKYGAVGLARDLLSVSDNLRRALQALPEDARDGDGWAKDLITGVELIEREFLDAFAKQGVVKMEPLGEAFDHNFHQAMFELEDPEKPAGTVVQLLQPGYRLHDRLLRAAMVGLSKGGPKAEKKQVEDSETGDDGA